jgi:hypothetical protein
MASTNTLRNAACTGLIILVLLGGLAAQDRSPVSGPLVGFVFDRAAGIRPVLGVPGAATLGQPVMRSSGLEAVVFSPVRDYALALAPRGGQVMLLRDLSTPGAAAGLQVAPGAARVAISPSGDVAVLYYPEAQAVSVLTGLPDAPVVSWSLEAPYLAGGLGALAVSDGGSAVLIAAAGDQSPVWLLTPATGARFLSYVSSSPSLAFLSKSSDAVIADAGNNTVVLVRDPAGQAETTRIGGAAEGLSRPVAVAVTADNRRVLVANAAPAGVVSLSLAGEEPLALTCNCVVTGLERLAGGVTFRLSAPGESPLWLLDAASSPPRIVFVPDSAPVPRRAVRRPAPVRPGGER